MEGQTQEHDAYVARVFGVDPATYLTAPESQGSTVASPDEAIGSDQTSAAEQPAQHASTAGKPVLKQGDKGRDVQDLQQQLNTHGAALTVDGDFGHLAKQAVLQFQSSNPPLKADGIVGPQTWAALAGSTPPPPPPP